MSCRCRSCNTQYPTYSQSAIYLNLPDLPSQILYPHEGYKLSILWSRSMLWWSREIPKMQLARSKEKHSMQAHWRPNRIVECEYWTEKSKDASEDDDRVTYPLLLLCSCAMSSHWWQGTWEVHEVERASWAWAHRLPMWRSFASLLGRSRSSPLLHSVIIRKSSMVANRLITLGRHHLPCSGDGSSV